MTDLVERLQQHLGTQYRIERELGGGGMSHVFLAEEVRVGRKVVIKVLPPEMSAAVNVDRFEREIRLAARLSHPHVVPFLTTGGSGDLLYYVMPYIEGESLRARLDREHELPIPEAVRILREVGDALAEAHRMGVVHRDIKPDNILLRARHALVADFGVAKAVADSGGSGALTSIGVALGTPAYMSPEQAVADPNVDHRTDIYALGCVAYEMLCGRPPFEGNTPQQMIAAHVTRTPDPVERYRDIVPPALAALVMRCLAKKPADRFQSVDEMMHALDSVATPGGMTPIASTPVGTAPYPATAPTWTAGRHDGTTAGLFTGHPVRVATYFVLGAIAVLALVSVLAKGIGLPAWVMPAAIGLLVVGLPIMVLTGLHERKRHVAMTTGLHVATPTGLPALFTWRRALLGGALAFGALALATGGYVLARNLGLGGVGTLMATGELDARDKMVLADFANRTTDSALGASVTDALRVDLAQSPVIRLLDAATVSAGLRRMQRGGVAMLDAELARELAQRENAKAVIAGEISPVGAGYVLTARIVGAADGRELVSLRETAKDETAIIGALDKLSKRLRERVGESLKSLQNTESLEQVTTASMEALRKYSQAVRLDDVGQPEPAYALLQEAVAADSTFAMAWRKLAVVAPRAGAPDSVARYAGRRALALKDRLPPVERHTAEASFYTNVEPDPVKAEAAQKAVLAIAPEDRVALNNYALLLNDQGRYAEAEAMARRAIPVDRSWFSYGHLARSLVGQGRYAEADSVLQELAEIQPGSPRNLSLQSELAYDTRDYRRGDSLMLTLAQASRSEVAQLTSLDGRANSAAVTGRLGEYERLLDSLRVVAERIGRRGSRHGTVLRRLELDNLFRPAPRYGKADLDTLLRAFPLDSVPLEVRSYYWFATAYADEGDAATARRLVAEGDRNLPAYLRDVPDRDWAEAQIAMAERRWTDAVAAYRTAEARPDAGCRNCLAYAAGRAFDAMGQPDSALAQYERGIRSPEAGRFDSDIGGLAIALRRAGELSEEKGDAAKAREYYNQFLELWQAADADLQPLVREVRGRLAALGTDK
jgi:tetratricopeptide (TPR) repeat protein